MWAKQSWHEGILMLTLNHNARRRLRDRAGRLALGVFCLSLSACTSLSARDQNAPATGSPTKQDQRAQLDGGYSLLYSGAKGVAKIKLILLAKVESDDVQKVVEDASDYGDAFASRLESISQDFPAVDIHGDPLPLMDQRMHAAQRKDIMFDFAPLAGQTGAIFERSLLLDLAGVVQHQRYMAQVTAEAETVPALKKILENAAQRYHQIYVEADKLLNAKYFKQDAYAHATTDDAS